MKHTHALAYLRQICCSGLSLEIAIAEFLRSLPMLIPSNSNTFSICDYRLRPTYHLAGVDVGDSAIAIRSILDDFHTPERLNRSFAWFSRNPAINDPRIIDERFYLTDMYNVIYRRFDMHHVLWIPVPLDAENTGVFGLYRSRQQKPFDRHDQAQIIHLAPYVVHAYRVTNEVSFEPSLDGESGMLIMNAHGGILYQSSEAKQMLEKARYPRLLSEKRKEDRLLAKLTELCRNLQNIYLGREAPPPSFSHTGPNGQFQFRAHWLEGCKQQSEGLIGISIEHREPLTLKILRAMRASPLSPTQKQVALMQAQGFTQDQIGKRLHIKPTTVKDHIGKIYLKLDIHQRDELLPKLISLSRAAQGAL